MIVPALAITKISVLIGVISTIVVALVTIIWDIIVAMTAIVEVAKISIIRLVLLSTALSIYY